MAPTAAWEVDTGSPNQVMIVTVTAAATVITTACSRSICVRFFRVSMPACPSSRAPSTTQAAHRPAAVQNRTMREATAEPKQLAASLAPRDHPRKTPPSSATIRRASSKP